MVMLAMIRMPIEYFRTKDSDRSVNAAIQGGGRGQKIATRVRSILGSVDSPNPFKGIPVTNHGENRIPHCFKYDLGDGWRLITQQSDKVCGFLFLGDHEDVDRWLDGHQGQRFGIRDGKTVLVPGSAQRWAILAGITPIITTNRSPNGCLPRRWTMSWMGFHAASRKDSRH